MQGKIIEITKLLEGQRFEFNCELYKFLVIISFPTSGVTEQFWALSENSGLGPLVKIVVRGP